jgi:hypothetical protein
MAVLEELTANLKRNRYALLLVALALACDVGWTQVAAARARRAWQSSSRQFDTCDKRALDSHTERLAALGDPGKWTLTDMQLLDMRTELDLTRCEATYLRALIPKD